MDQELKIDRAIIWNSTKSDFQHLKNIVVNSSISAKLKKYFCAKMTIIESNMKKIYDAESE